MNTLLRSLIVSLASLTATTALAQTTPTLEFAAGVGNPTGNGPTLANQVITFQNNAGNPSNNTMAPYTPTTTTTFALSNQQYTLATTRISTGKGVSFGARANQSGTQASAGTMFDLLSSIGGSANGNYTSADGVTGGIDVGINSGTEIFTSAEPLSATVPANARYQYADLTLTFNRAVTNPVVHITGLGAAYGSFGFTAELDLLTTGVSLSKLSGSTELTINSTQILNNATMPGAVTGSGGASGSVLVTTPRAGISSLVFRIYLRPAAAGGAIHTTDASSHAGDSWLISVSTKTATTATTLAAAPLPVELAAFTAQAAAGRNAQLNWTTASELHNAYFDVERSLDGTQFEKIGRLTGQGSKTSATSYAFTDTGIGQRATGAVYYRLRQVDTDGTATFSPVRTVRFDGAAVATAAARLYPNPAQASSSLDLSELPATASYQVRLLDATGTQAQGLTAAGGQVQPLALDALRPGLYTVLVTGQQADGTAFRQTLRLAKQ